MTNPKQILRGDKVEGLYHGQPFKGVVFSADSDQSGYRDMRNVVRFHVTLEKQIEVYGEMRDSVVISADGNSWDLSEPVSLISSRA